MKSLRMAKVPPRTRPLFDVGPTRKQATGPDLLIVQFRAVGLPEPERELQFAKLELGRRWSFDYAWPETRIALEIEGGMFGGRVMYAGEETYEVRKIRGIRQRILVKPGSVIRVGGRHNTGAGMVGDLEKYNSAAMLGWMVIRVTTAQVRDRLVPDLMLEAFAARTKYCPLSLTERTL